MIRSLLFRWWFSRNQFARALAALPPGGQLALMSYAFYRLGMYGMVVRMGGGSIHWRDRLAYGISLCACGRMDEGSAVLQMLIAAPDLAKHRNRIVEAVTAFAPDLALAWTSAQSQPALHAALLIRARQQEGTTAFVKSSIASGAAQKSPDQALVDLYQRTVIHATQLNGGLHSRGGIDLAVVHASRVLTSSKSLLENL